jgi:hypothetical protein
MVIVWVPDELCVEVCVCERVIDCVGDCEMLEVGLHAVFRARSHMLPYCCDATNVAPAVVDTSGVTATPLSGTGWWLGTSSADAYQNTGEDARHASSTLDAFVVLTTSGVPSDSRLYAGAGVRNTDVAIDAIAR